MQIQHSTSVSSFPCLGPFGQYTSFPCSQCTAPACWMGKKPVQRGARVPGVHCLNCGECFDRCGRKRRYCSDACRYAAMMRRRKARRVGGCL